ncbi:cbb3-type cytochrome c oxidase subunit I [Methylobacillus caricis]|uniref:cbb3-type cytochrome c oxidase subunit I n=1 Tax=Methylobacillus caricis TaxID=1971611 RepID=UPI001CFFE77D|nr:cbb3-type cytochrome c oxidase subunit I [Methylobacillus caricis]MCB5186639.1 cbb3-type cytochrome c oxidase subunit I [Methylobacillus caricis]
MSTPVTSNPAQEESTVDHSKIKVSPEEMEAYDQSGRKPVLLGFFIAVVWLLIGTVLGDLSSFKFDRPDLLTEQAYLTFGRIRPAHLNVMVYGWASTAMFSVSLWLMPRLCRTPLRWGNLAVIGILVWTVGLGVGIALLLAGHGDGLEWLELDRQWADPLLVIGAAMVGASVWKTLAARNVHHLYVSIWYVAASYPWFLIIFLAGNMPFYKGVESAAVNWFYAHNALGLWLTTINLGLIYYLLPKIIGRPIYSYWLSLVGFWGLALFYALNGMHHLIGGPLPSWMIATSITASIMMIVPVVAVGINQHMTVVGRFGAMRYSPALTLAVIAAMSYTAVSLQGILTALVSVNRITHFTHWTIAHSHLGLYMFVTLSLFGGMYYILPRVLKKEWPSRRLVRAHILLVGGGMVLYIVALGIGGVLQGLSLLAPGEGFEASVSSAKPWLLLRSVSAVIISAGHLVFAYHAYLLAFTSRNSLTRHPPFYELKPVLVKKRVP